MNIKSKNTVAKGLDQLLDEMKSRALQTRSTVRDDKRDPAADKPRANMLKSSDTIR